MIQRWGMTCAALVLTALFAGCTGGSEGAAAEEKAPSKNPIVTSTSTMPAAQAQPQFDVRQELKAINHAIPVYAGAKYRDDLTHRDAVMVRSQYGPQAEVYTLATDDSFPQVYHYYTTYLAQFRALPPKSPYPPEQDWRTLEVQLNQVMQDPFIPGNTLAPGSKQVTLQVVETEAEPKTVIRYIVTPPQQASQVAAGSSQ
jgi:hypothetical protein